MFGNPITNSKNFNMVQFDKVIVLQRGFDLPTYMRDETGEIDVWGANGILAKHTEAKVMNEGVITGRSGSIGNVYYTRKDFWPLNTTLFSKETYGNNVIYLAYLLREFKLERFVNGTGVPTLNRNLVHAEKIIDVSIELQNQFADFVQQVDKLKFEVEKNKNALKNFYCSKDKNYYK